MATDRISAIEWQRQRQLHVLAAGLTGLPG
jgi:hypothetical protein